MLATPRTSSRGQCGAPLRPRPLRDDCAVESLRLPEGFTAAPSVKSPNEIDYQVSVPADALHGDYANLALEADGVLLGRARLQLFRPDSALLGGLLGLMQQFDALRQLRAGNVADAIAWYADNDRIRIAPDAHEALQATVDAWYADVCTGRDAAITGPPGRSRSTSRRWRCCSVTS